MNGISKMSEFQLLQKEKLRKYGNSMGVTHLCYYTTLHQLKVDSRLPLSLSLYFPPPFFPIILEKKKKL